MMQTLLQDMRYGARMLWKNPAFTAVAVIAIAIGIVDFAVCERLPVVVIVWVQMHRIIPGPVIDVVSCGIGRSPMNSDCVD